MGGGKKKKKFDNLYSSARDADRVYRIILDVWTVKYNIGLDFRTIFLEEDVGTT